MERKPFSNINFRVDFVKTFNRTHLEMAAFGLFYKVTLKHCEMGVLHSGAKNWDRLNSFINTKKVFKKRFFETSHNKKCIVF